MGMVTIVSGKPFKKTKGFLERSLELIKLGWLDKYGRRGVEALSMATPVDTGKTAASWSYEIERHGSDVVLAWKNSNVNKGVPIALVIQYGHVLSDGTYIAGRDYINPAIQPIFDEMSKEIGEEVKRL